MSTQPSYPGRSTPIFHVEAARTQNRWINHVLAVGGADDDDVVQLLDAVDLRKLRHNRGLTSEEIPEPRVQKKRAAVEEDDDGDAVRGAGCRRGKGSPWRIWRSVSPTYLTRELRALDVEEAGARGGVTRLSRRGVSGERGGEQHRDEEIFPHPGGP